MGAGNFAILMHAGRTLVVSLPRGTDSWGTECYVSFFCERHFLKNTICAGMNGVKHPLNVAASSPCQQSFQ